MVASNPPRSTNQYSFWALVPPATPVVSRTVCCFMIENSELRCDDLPSSLLIFSSSSTNEGPPCCGSFCNVLCQLYSSSLSSHHVKGRDGVQALANLFKDTKTRLRVKIVQSRISAYCIIVAPNIFPLQLSRATVPRNVFLSRALESYGSLTKVSAVPNGPLAAR